MTLSSSKVEKNKERQRRQHTEWLEDASKEKRKLYSMFDTEKVNEGGYFSRSHIKLRVSQ